MSASSLPRPSPLAALAEESVDTLILGGGLHGVGVAAALSLAGYRVALVEPKDIAWGASGRTPRRLESGLDALLVGRPRRAAAIVSERLALLERAPHLVRAAPLLLPPRDNEGRARRRAELWLPALHAALFARRRGWPDPRRIDAESAALLVPGSRLPEAALPLRFAALVDDRRLALLWALEARSAGTLIATRSELVGLEAHTRQRARATVRDNLSGEMARFETRAILNASGAWVDRTRGQLGLERAAPLVETLRGVQRVVRRRVDAGVRGPRLASGESLVVVPALGGLLAGRLEMADASNPDAALASVEELERIDEALDALLEPEPGARRLALVGVRGRAPGREPARLVAEESEGIPLFSLVGGSLAMLRRTTRSTAARVAARLGPPLAPRSARPPATLAGGDLVTLPGLEAAARAQGLEAHQARWLVGRYGSLWREFLEGEVEPEPLGPSGIPLAAEIAWGIEEEGARTLSDLLLRMRLPELVADDAEEQLVAERALALMTRHLGLSEAAAERERERWRRERRAVYP